MKLTTRFVSNLGVALCFCVGAPTILASQTLSEVVAGAHRTASFAARDEFRHPVETLSFFGIRNSMTVVEISPGGGWYTEILAPYLKDNGTFVAAGYDPDSKIEYYSKGAARFQQKLASNPEVFGNTVLSIMQPPEKLDFAEPGSVDLVLTFRNTHNWHRGGNAQAVYAAVFKALKSGGVFGVVQHRAGDGVPADTSGKLGYLRQSDVVELAEKAGFKLVAQSEINANPRDSHDHKQGVWSLPPSYREKDVNREKYKAIGESDRMTLKFIKP